MVIDLVEGTKLVQYKGKKYIDITSICINFNSNYIAYRSHFFNRKYLGLWGDITKRRFLV